MFSTTSLGKHLPIKYSFFEDVPSILVKMSMCNTKLLALDFKKQNKGQKGTQWQISITGGKKKTQK